VHFNICFTHITDKKRIKGVKAKTGGKLYIYTVYVCVCVYIYIFIYACVCVWVCVFAHYRPRQISL